MANYKLLDGKLMLESNSQVKQIILNGIRVFIYIGNINCADFKDKNTRPLTNSSFWVRFLVWARLKPSRPLNLPLNIG